MPAAALPKHSGPNGPRPILPRSQLPPTDQSLRLPDVKPSRRLSLPSHEHAVDGSRLAHSRSMGDISTEAMRSLGSGIGLGISLGDEDDCDLVDEPLPLDIGLPKSRAQVPPLDAPLSAEFPTFGQGPAAHAPSMQSGQGPPERAPSLEDAIKLLQNVPCDSGSSNASPSVDVHPAPSSSEQSLARIATVKAVNPPTSRSEATSGGSSRTSVTVGDLSTDGEVSPVRIARRDMPGLRDGEAAERRASLRSLSVRSGRCMSFGFSTGHTWVRPKPVPRAANGTDSTSAINEEDCVAEIQSSLQPQPAAVPPPASHAPAVRPRRPLPDPIKAGMAQSTALRSHPLSAKDVLTRLGKGPSKETPRASSASVRPTAAPRPRPAALSLADSESIRSTGVFTPSESASTLAGGSPARLGCSHLPRSQTVPEHLRTMLARTESPALGQSPGKGGAALLTPTRRRGLPLRERLRSLQNERPLASTLSDADTAEKLCPAKPGQGATVTAPTTLAEAKSDTPGQGAPQPAVLCAVRAEARNEMGATQPTTTRTYCTSFKSVQCPSPAQDKHEPLESTTMVPQPTIIPLSDRRLPRSPSLSHPLAHQPALASFGDRKQSRSPSPPLASPACPLAPPVGSLPTHALSGPMQAPARAEASLSSIPSPFSLPLPGSVASPSKENAPTPTKPRASLRRLATGSVSARILQLQSAPDASGPVSVKTSTSVRPPLSSTKSPSRSEKSSSGSPRRGLELGELGLPKSARPAHPATSPAGPVSVPDAMPAASPSSSRSAYIVFDNKSQVASPSPSARARTKSAAPALQAAGRPANAVTKGGADAPFGVRLRSVPKAPPPFAQPSLKPGGTLGSIPLRHTPNRPTEVVEEHSQDGDTTVLRITRASAFEDLSKNKIHGGSRCAARTASPGTLFGVSLRSTQSSPQKRLSSLAKPVAGDGWLRTSSVTLSAVSGATAASPTPSDADSDRGSLVFQTPQEEPTQTLKRSAAVLSRPPLPNLPEEATPAPTPLKSPLSLCPHTSANDERVVEPVAGPTAGVPRSAGPCPSPQHSAGPAASPSHSSGGESSARQSDGSDVLTGSVYGSSAPEAFAFSPPTPRSVADKGSTLSRSQRPSPSTSPGKQSARSLCTTTSLDAAAEAMADVEAAMSALRMALTAAGASIR